jgi:hypothetical protein
MENEGSRTVACRRDRRWFLTSRTSSFVFHKPVYGRDEPRIAGNYLDRGIVQR